MATDPVDTDALRAKAREVGRKYRSALAAEIECDTLAAADELDRLRAVIENAPHDPLCQWDRTDALAYRGRVSNCTCWKADAP